MVRSSSINALVPISIVLIFITTASLLTVKTKAFSSLSRNARTAQQQEAVVRRYFDGVDKKDPVQIRSCFGETATIRDVCGVSNTVRTVQASVLVERCMEFVTAHPDCKVDFHYGPEKGRTSEWVVAHWFETGTNSGDSCGIPGNNKPMAVEGQTRFLVDQNALKITDMVVTRTFTEWEERMLEKRLSEAQANQQ
jgi:hypothetical protein